MLVVDGGDGVSISAFAAWSGRFGVYVTRVFEEQHHKSVCGSGLLCLGLDPNSGAHRV